MNGLENPQGSLPENNTEQEQPQHMKTVPTSENNIGKKNKKLSFPWYVSVLAVILAALITFMATYSVLFVRFSAERDQAVINNNAELVYDKNVLKALAQIYENYYVGELGSNSQLDYTYLDMNLLRKWDKASVTDALASMYVAWTGDRYGEYYSPSQMDELNNFFAGETVGIGVIVVYDSESGLIEIVYTMEGSPAAKAGIQVGDIIYKVGNDLVSEMTYDEATGRIRGEEGSKLSLMVLRQNGEEQQELTLEVTRATVVAQTVFHRMSESSKTGIIRITEFTNETPSQFKKAIDELEALGAENYVFDLRDNGGGTLVGVQGVLSYLLDKGTAFIKVVDKYGTESIDYVNEEYTLKKPMAVLVNGNTASAAELFTINMRDYEKATIIGENTFGKGVMQTYFDLPNGGMVKVTYKWYSSPLSDNYDGVGIKPHVEVKMAEEFATTNLFKLAEKDDNQLQAALSKLNG